MVDSRNFVSLLYFFGLLTFKGEQMKGDPVLTIPNESIRFMMYEYIRESYWDTDVFAVDMYYAMCNFKMDGSKLVSGVFSTAGSSSDSP